MRNQVLVRLGQLRITQIHLERIQDRTLVEGRLNSRTNRDPTSILSNSRSWLLTKLQTLKELNLPSRVLLLYSPQALDKHLSKTLDLEVAVYLVKNKLNNHQDSGNNLKPKQLSKTQDLE
jgi:hypothetical protein